MIPTFIELCAGAGGLSKGFINKGFQPLLLCDNNKDCYKTLRMNHPDYVGVITQVDIRELHLNDVKVDVLVAGIPCQSFSQAGKRKGLHDKRGDLIFEFLRLLQECKPKMFVIENVKGLVTLHSGKVLDDILLELSQLGYNVKHRILNAVDFGVPQKRERVFIIGSINDDFEFPVPKSTKKMLRDVLLDIPENDDGYCTYSENKAKVMALVPPGGCWVDLPQGIKEEYMGSSLHSGGGKRGMARRLSYDEPCLTLTTSPNQKQTERCHPSETRPFTVREYARIQTFPDDYKFCGSVSSKYRQIGNAVPVKLAEAVAQEIEKVLFRT